MRKSLIALVCLSTVVGGCGQAAEDAADKAFDENFRSTCISSASGGAMPAELATQACDCALAKINETYSATEKLTLSDEQAMPIALECFEKVMPANG